MAKKVKRKRLLIHPSSQLKYIGFSILPSLVISIVCTYFLINTGELIFKTDREQLLASLSSINYLSMVLDKQGCDTQKIKMLRKEFLSFQNLLGDTFFDAPIKWGETKVFLFIIIAIVLLSIGFFSLIYSHKMTGPIFNIRKSIDMLCAGEDIPSVRLRKHDEFKELAESVNRLKRQLQAKGMLRPSKKDGDNNTIT